MRKEATNHLRDFREPKLLHPDGLSFVGCRKLEVIELQQISFYKVDILIPEFWLPVIPLSVCSLQNKRKLISETTEQSRSGIKRTSYFGFHEKSSRDEDANNHGRMRNEVVD